MSSAVWAESKASGSSLLVLISLADQANDEGWCWPSVGNIAKRCRLTERSIQYILRELEDAGEVARTERPGRSTMYRILIGQRGEAGFTGEKNAPLQPTAPGGATDSTPGVQPTAPRNVSEPSRNTRGRVRSLPAGWQPNDRHREMASEKGLQVEVEAERFRNHAEQNDRKVVRWDAAFNNWLLKAGERIASGRPDDNGYYSLWGG